MSPRAKVLTANSIDWGKPAASAGAKADGCTEAAHAERFAATYGDELKYDLRRNLWLRWHHGFWAEDRIGHRYGRVVELARRLYRDAATISDIEQRRRTGQLRDWRRVPLPD